MVRSGDYYVDHRERMEIARRRNADLFISIHADAVDDRRARGASVYVLSLKGASDEAGKLLAERENASDAVPGISLAGKDAMTASVLLDMSQNAALSASLNVGGGSPSRSSLRSEKVQPAQGSASWFPGAEDTQRTVDFGRNRLYLESRRRKETQ